ncbi:MAG: helix-hairpin-helix domain-containing protein, partial [bacterium]|nr:helix-hairpin-helix domain-containing protein [bacterium]
KGKFKSIEEIINIYGIGQKRFDKLKDKITVE